MSIIDSGLGWSCNSNFYCNDTSTEVVKHGTEVAYKVESGGAIVANVFLHNYWHCAIISTNKNFAQTDNTENIYVHTAYNGSAVFAGLTWHMYIQGSGTLSSQTTFPEVTVENEETIGEPGNMPLTIKEILEAAGVAATVERRFASYNNALDIIGAVANKLDILNITKQPKTMSAAVTVDGTTQSTVESAISAVNTYTSVKISDIYANLGIYGSDVYGLQVDYQNYIYTRLAGAAGKTAGTDFNSLAPWSGIKRCNLADDGTVNAYYGDVSYIEDGSNGQVMVEIPKFYYRVVPLKLDPIGDSAGGKHLRKANYYISATKYEGFKTHPHFIKPDGTERDKAYVSAYEGCIYDVSESAYILDDAQTADFTATTGDKLSSIANAKPASGLTQNLTRANSEILATNRGTGWHCMDVRAASAVQLLFMIEYGTLNSQNAIGLGVVSKASGTGNEAEITGTTSSLGNSTGMASGTNGLVSISYRGIENFYGNIWKFVEGLNLWGDGTLRGGQPYICDDYTFTENTKTGYTAAKFTVSNSNSYISAFGYDPDFDWLFLPSECMNANSNYPVGDGVYITSDLNRYMSFSLGANWGDGAAAGAFYWNAVRAESHYRTISARLMYIS